MRSPRSMYKQTKKSMSTINVLFHGPGNSVCMKIKLQWTITIRITAFDIEMHWKRHTLTWKSSRHANITYRHDKLLILKHYITLFNHMGWFRDPRICQLHSVGPSNKVIIFSFMFIRYIQVDLGDMDGVILLVLCIGVNVQLKNICRVHCSLHVNVFNSVINSVLIIEMPTVHTIFLLFIIRINVNCFTISKLLLMKVR